eukprot:9298025-Pyramimonas_sp.AAC.1
MVSKGASPWTPATTLSLDGVVVADPLSLLKAEASKFSKLWGDGGTGSWFEIGELAPPLPPVPVEAIRDFSRELEDNTSVSVDGFHMKHFSYMSDASLLM